MTWSIEEWNSKAFMQWAGLRVLSASDGTATLELDVRDHHRGGGGTRAINGAIVAYMHDVIQGIAIGSLLEANVLRMATLHLNIEYPKLLLCDDKAVATARVLRLGHTIAFCDSDFRDAAGDICSRSTGTYQIKRSRASDALAMPPPLAGGPVPPVAFTTSSED